MSISDSNPPPAGLSGRMTLLLAFACGLVVANLYYAQPLLSAIGPDLALAPQQVGLVVTLAQVGYGLGLLLIVPLGDRLESRRLTLSLILLAAAALVLAGLAPGMGIFLLAMLGIGLGSVAVQVLVPYAAHLAPEAIRGQAVGNVVSGLLIGIMLARPVSSFIAGVTSWQMVFLCSAGAMLGLVLLLRRALPPRQPLATLGYFELLKSMWLLWRTTPILRRRAAYQACLFGAFSLFWTTTPLLLLGPSFQLSQFELGLFALAGVAGALASPIAGWLADRDWGRPTSGLAMLGVALAFGLTWNAESGSRGALIALVSAAVLLDFSATANLVVGQRAIFVLGAEYRSRLNGLYMATFFAGGALGSALGGWAFATGGWTLVVGVGMGLPLLALLYFLSELWPGSAQA